MIKKVATNGITPGLENAGAPGPINPKTGQHTSYWVLSDEDKEAGLVRPIRDAYYHDKCGSKTVMGSAIAYTYAIKPFFYGATFCCNCGNHYPVGEKGEFTWEDGTKVGT